MWQLIKKYCMVFLLLGTVHVALAADPYVFTQIDVPGAARTQARGINDARQITGWFADADGNFHGYLRSADVFTQLDVPNATATLALGLNNAAHMVGVFDDANAVSHGFDCDASAACTAHDPPGARVNSRRGE